MKKCGKSLYRSMPFFSSLESIFGGQNFEMDILVDLKVLQSLESKSYFNGWSMCMLLV